MNKLFLIVLALLCLFVGSCGKDEIRGCTEPSSCNYDKNATIYIPSSCLELDKCGECGGDNSTCLDECGVVNGNTIEECGSCDFVYLWGECYNIKRTHFLNFWGGELTGEIPPEIGKLTNLIDLNLSFNQLTGEIPSEIGNLKSLNNLTLANNQLTGQIPESICQLSLYWPDIRYKDSQKANFYIHNNQLCPPYPNCTNIVNNTIVPITVERHQDTSNCP